MSTDDNKDEQANLMTKGEGVTDAERYLQRLAEKSFLSLWSYPNVCRNEKGTCKEICDLLVVFEKHLIIFSDKNCAFQDKGDLDVDWSRWYRNAVLENAKQIWGAEKHIRKNSDNIFLDCACTKRFPIDLPSPDEFIVHRIVVAHAASERCKKELGGSGSLMIKPDIIGDQHTAKHEDGGTPFAIGQIDPARGYVHVFDDTTLEIVMATLDTISDFVAYLSSKEKFITSGKLVLAAGEEDLLAVFLQNYDGDGNHNFVLPSHIRKAIIPSGWWTQYANSAHRRAQVAANQISYKWDDLVERCLTQIHSGTSYFLSHDALSDSEQTWRLLARENRTSRRILAQCLVEFISKQTAIKIASRTIMPFTECPVYLFFTLPSFDVYSSIQRVSLEEYYQNRHQHLLDRCMIAKIEYSDAVDIVGICVDRSPVKITNLIHIRKDKWTPELQAEAERLKRKYGTNGLRGDFTWRQSITEEYPSESTSVRQHTHKGRISTMNGGDRNALCWCGSGKKFKKCHG